jgi:tricarballylate dehydrogenase
MYFRFSALQLTHTPTLRVLPPTPESASGLERDDTDGAPIPGLYAAGELVGGIFWFNYSGGTGLTNGAVFGRIAGTSAAR